MKTRRWDFVSDHAKTFGVQRICRVLQVSRSGLLPVDRRQGGPCRAAVADDALVAEVHEIHTEHKGFVRLSG
ncbi:IS3 family transposase, partial [Streptomyces sp. ISL-100]|nr:IS3 family transposase [Streptomyces sp. ISL-100]